MCLFVFPPKIVKNLMDCLWWNRLFCVQAYNFNHKWPQEPPTGRDRWFCLWTRWFDFPMIFLKIIELWFDLIFWKINMILFDLISIFICLTALFFLPLRKTILNKTTQLHALLLERFWFLDKSSNFYMTCSLASIVTTVKDYLSDYLKGWSHMDVGWMDVGCPRANFTIE